MTKKHEGLITSKAQQKEETRKEVKDVAAKKLQHKMQKLNRGPSMKEMFSEELGLTTYNPAHRTHFDDTITINISGMRFETTLSTLNMYPETLLGNPQKRAFYYNPLKEEYFFNRHRPSFDAILYYYQSGGKLERPNNVPVEVFSEEIKFFQLGKHVYELYRKEEGYVKPVPPIFPKNKLQRQIWCLLEHPETSAWARLLALISVSVIMTSIVSFIVESMPKYVNMYNKTNSTNGDPVQLTDNPFFVVETACIIFFSIELIARFATCPLKRRFWFNFLNIIDLVAILPYYITVIMYAFSEEAKEDVATASSLAILRIFRLIRVFRVFKLSRHAKGLQVLGKTIQSSIKELAMLGFFLSIGVILFGAGAYFAEMDVENTEFKSIPHSFWWALITMTTVGYGDMSPVTAWGKLVGSLCGVTGVLTIAMPVPVIVSNFSYYYHREKDLTEYDENIHGVHIDEESVDDRRPDNGGLANTSFHMAGEDPELSLSL